MAEKMAVIFNQKDDQVYYRQLIEASKDKIHRTFFNQGTRDYVNGQQTYLALPLLIGLAPENLVDELDAKLEHLITVANDGHLQTGMLGTYFLLKYLMKTGRNDLAYLIMNQRTYPGYGYMVEQGATTVWEQWNGHNSQTHNCYLAGGMWFIQGLGGIRPDEETPGFKHFFIHQPYIENLDHADVSHACLYGTIRNNWKKHPDRLTSTVEIPLNTTATYVIPPRLSFSAVQINGEKAVSKKDATTGHHQLSLSPGTHEIEISFTNKSNAE
jgi:alpha-L-rhamnosidase